MTLDNRVLPQYRVFFSWQSDKKQKSDFIKSALDGAVKQLKKANFDVHIELGGGGQGFINIEQAIRQKIRMCDIFVGDVTPVGSYCPAKSVKKSFPNSNVMFELGIATETMCPENVFAIALKGDDFDFNTLPFDVNHYSFVTIDENKKNAINTLSKKLLKGILSSIEKSRRRYEGYFATWSLQKNIDSKKYLPDTYLENIEYLEKVRCFAEPSKYYDKIWEYLNRCDFSLFNQGKIYQGKKAAFKLSLAAYDLRKSAVDLETINSYSRRLLNYVQKKDEELNHMGNAGWSVSHKLRYAKETLPYISAKYLIVLSDAGAGKTNFVCNIVQNLFQGDGIPYIYVNAYELSADYVAQSLAFEHNYIGSGSLDEVFCRVSRYCEQHRQYMLVVIDGLNEHQNYKIFVQNLTKVLRAMANYPYLKAILTCRYDFYQKNMTIIPTTLDDKLLTIELNRRGHLNELDNYSLSRVIERYFRHFDITGELHEDVKKEFKDNMLLLRLFCEAYRGKDVTIERFLRYDDVFERYYLLQCHDIQDLIKPVATDDIEDDLSEYFFDVIILWIIDNKVYRNIPYNKILDVIPDNKKKFFPQFVNSNLLVKRDLIEDPVDSGEKINFTYEEVRDYLIARYLVRHFTSHDNISNVMDELTENTNNCAEGVKRFLFLISMNTGNEESLQMIKTKDWYIDTFKSFIWYVRDENIQVKEYSNILETLSIDRDAWFWIRLINTRWNIKVYPQFNILIALMYLESLTPEARKKMIQEWLPSPEEQERKVRHLWSNNRKDYISSLEKVLAIQTNEGNQENVQVLLRLLNIFIKLEESMGVESYAIKLSRKYSQGNLAFYSNPTKKFDPKTCHLFAYGAYKYLLVHNKDLSLDIFLQRVGARAGYAKDMFTDIYNAIFIEGDDVRELFNTYYVQEYQSIENFLLKYYSLPLSLAAEWATLLDSGKEIVCFDSLSYGLPQIDDFILGEMFDRFDKVFQ